MNYIDIFSHIYQDFHLWKIWNLVAIQCEKSSHGSLTTKKKKTFMWMSQLRKEEADSEYCPSFVLLYYLCSETCVRQILCELVIVWNNVGPIYLKLYLLQFCSCICCTSSLFWPVYFCSNQFLAGREISLDGWQKIVLDGSQSSVVWVR